MTFNFARLVKLVSSPAIVTIRNRDNTKAGISFDFAPNASQAQIDQANAILAEWNPTADPDADALIALSAQWKTVLAPLKNMTPDQIATAVQNRINSWTTLTQAKVDLVTWMPVLVAVVAWTTMKDSQRD